ncbi:hypothetical protein I546_4543 [Mycobacterium kansasii 732]|nr:hypothetical protein I546_4543 [Mycobacterium kansasii 732]
MICREAGSADPREEELGSSVICDCLHVLLAVAAHVTSRREQDLYLLTGPGPASA